MYLLWNSPKVKEIAEILSSNLHLFPVFNVLMTVLASVDARFPTNLLPCISNTCFSLCLCFPSALGGSGEGGSLGMAVPGCQDADSRFQCLPQLQVAHSEGLWQGWPDALVVKRSNLCIPVPSTYCCCQAPLHWFTGTQLWWEWRNLFLSESDRE